eukprot:c19133_g1_i1 orf=349-2523(-)
MTMADHLPFNSSTLSLAYSEERSSEDKDGSEASALSEKSITGRRRSRMREITSRYRFPATSSSSSSVSISNRHVQPPNIDRIVYESNPTYTNRSESVEQRRSSPTRAEEFNGSSESMDRSFAANRVLRRAGILWPSTQRTSMSAPGGLCSPPSKRFSKLQIDGRGRSNCQFSDPNLKPSDNEEQSWVDQSKGTTKRNGTSEPERKRTSKLMGIALLRQNMDQAENAKPADNIHSKPEQYYRPGTSNAKVLGGAISRSMDLIGNDEKPISRTASLVVQGQTPYNNAPRTPRPLRSSRSLSQSITEVSALCNVVCRTEAENRGRSRNSPSVTRKLPGRESAQIFNSKQFHVSRGQEAHSVRQSKLEPKLTIVDCTQLSDKFSDTGSVSSGDVAFVTASTREISGSGTVKVVRGAVVPARIWQDATGRSKCLSEINRLGSPLSESEMSSTTSGKSDKPQNIAVTAISSSWSSPSLSALAFSSSQQSLSPIKVPQIGSTRSFRDPIGSGGCPVSLSARTLQSSKLSRAGIMLAFGVNGTKGKKRLSQAEEAQFLSILHNRLLQWRFVNALAEVAMNNQRTEAEASQLEDWLSLEEGHSGAFSGVVEALDGAILRVPVNIGVRADIQTVKEAMGSAVDVINAIESFVTSLLPKVEKTSCSVSELAQVAAQERAFLEECGDLLATAAAFEVEQRSLRAQFMQLEKEKARVLGHLMDTSQVSSTSVLLNSS